MNVTQTLRKAVAAKSIMMNFVLGSEWFDHVKAKKQKRQKIQAKEIMSKVCNVRKYEFSNLQFPLTNDNNVFSLSLSMKVNIPKCQCRFTLLTTVCIVGGVTSRSLYL